jgi:acyl-coenzyme A thioesterase PaaI-like protein
MSESFSTAFQRRYFNLYPAYWAMGARITYIAHDYREIRIALPLSLRTRNYVGTIFGGSMYGAVDPIYMVMLVKNLGPEYVVWDKAATIRFRRPGRSTLQATFRISKHELDAIRHDLVHRRSVDRTWQVDLVDEKGKVHAEVEKVLYVGRKR